MTRRVSLKPLRHISEANIFKYFSVSETVKGVTTLRHLIEAEEFKHVLMTFGDKLTQEEIDDIFGEFDFDDDGFILTKSVVRIICLQRFHV